jgi:hypothetical protein
MGGRGGGGSGLVLGEIRCGALQPQPRRESTMHTHGQAVAVRLIRKGAFSWLIRVRLLVPAPPAWTHPTRTVLYRSVVPPVPRRPGEEAGATSKEQGPTFHDVQGGIG